MPSVWLFLNSNDTLHRDFCGAVDYIFARPERGGTKSGGGWERITGTTVAWTLAGHCNARIFCCSRFWGILVSQAKQEVLVFWTLLHINWKLNYNLRVYVSDFVYTLVYTPLELRPKSGRGSQWSKESNWLKFLTCMITLADFLGICGFVPICLLVLVFCNLLWTWQARFNWQVQSRCICLYWLSGSTPPYRLSGHLLNMQVHVVHVDLRKMRFHKTTSQVVPHALL